MGLFGRGKEKTEPPPPPPAPRPQADFLSPLWSQWPPAAEPPAPPAPAPVVTPPPPRAPAPLVTPPPPPRAPRALPAAPLAMEVMHTMEAIEVEAELVLESPVPPRPPARPPSAYPPPGRPLSSPPAPARPSSIPQVMPRRSSSRPAPAQGPAELMRQAMAQGDFLSARAIADKILAYDPTDLEAHTCLSTCDRYLSQSWEARLGDRARVLRIAVPTDWLPQLAIDSRVAYVVSRIDGVTSIQSILDCAGLPEADCAKVLLDLLDEGVLEVRPPLPRKSSFPPR